ncbi:NAD-dependent deacetylase [Evansella sp. AB-rgal1]|uniref:SIR2 family NAD-dependent protein deacylase n=1 Tax=Evansella sp. AB-rgal1 TaxID=3242696 RepID=UPI00359D0C2F
MEKGQTKKLAELIKSSSHTVILTGAGMSTESGVPDFRSKEGWWKEIDPRTVASVEALEDNYPLFREFYSTRLKALQTVQPHEGHKIIAKWEKNGLVQCVATQNVDGLHQKAGSIAVKELHGSIRKIRCNQCGNEAAKEQFITGESCNACRGKLRPSVVLFGELLPQIAWQSAFQHIQKADLVIVIGTSLEVYPVSELPAMTNGKTVLINKDPVWTAHHFFLTIEGNAKEVLHAVDELV